MSSSKFEEVINKIINDSPPGELREVYDDLIKITSENSKILFWMLLRITTCRIASL